MSEKIKPGDVVRHIHLQDSPEMYVVELKTGKVDCRYFSNGLFHLETFALEEVLSKEKAEAIKKEQDAAHAAGMKSLLNRF